MSCRVSYLSIIARSQGNISADFPGVRTARGPPPPAGAPRLSLSNTPRCWQNDGVGELVLLAVGGSAVLALGVWHLHYAWRLGRRALWGAFVAPRAVVLAYYAAYASAPCPAR